MKKPKFKFNIITCVIGLTIIISLGMIIKGIMVQPSISVNAEKTAQLAQEVEAIISNVFVDISGQ